MTANADPLGKGNLGSRWATQKNEQVDAWGGLRADFWVRGAEEDAVLPNKGKKLGFLAADVNALGKGDLGSRWVTQKDEQVDVWGGLWADFWVRGAEDAALPNGGKKLRFCDCK